jgi:hypothetical protein
MVIWPHVESSNSNICVTVTPRVESIEKYSKWAQAPPMIDPAALALFAPYCSSNLQVPGYTSFHRRRTH